MRKQRHSREWWRKTVAAFESSGATRADFCERRGLVVSTLQHWRQQFRREAKSPAFALVHVEPLQAPEPPPRPKMVEATLPSGLSLRFEIGTDPHYLSSLLAGLSGC